VQEGVLPEREQPFSRRLGQQAPARCPTASNDRAEAILSRPFSCLCRVRLLGKDGTVPIAYSAFSCLPVEQPCRPREFAGATRIFGATLRAAGVERPQRCNLIKTFQHNELKRAQPWAERHQIGQRFRVWGEQQVDNHLALPFPPVSHSASRFSDTVRHWALRRLGGVQDPYASASSKLVGASAASAAASDARSASAAVPDAASCWTSLNVWVRGSFTAGSTLRRAFHRRCASMRTLHSRNIVTTAHSTANVLPGERDFAS
jgi:hypothetical protein